VLVYLERMRSEIQAEMDEQNIEIDANRLTDVNLLKRHVLKRCVYGVDLNPMAVELAKVSLWLDCFTLGAPLSFLDHHLRWGNSLIGSTVSEVDAIREAKGQLTLTGTSDWQGLTQAVQTMIDVGGMPDITPAQVASSKQHYESALTGVEVFKRVLDLHTARWFVQIDAPKGNGKKKVDIFDELLRSGELFTWAHGHADSPVAHTGMGKVGRDAVARADVAAKEKRFFHWELEFPEVFYGRRAGTQTVVERLDNAGFDAVIGNPPYDVMEKERGEDDAPHEELQAYLKRNERFQASLGGKLNLYRPFMIASLLLLRESGHYSQIIPMSFMADISVTNTRVHVLTAHRLIEVVAFPQKDDENQRVFKEAKLSTCIPLVKAKCADPASAFVALRFPANNFSDQPEEVNATIADLRMIDNRTMPIPSCNQAELNLAIRIHSKSLRLEEVADITRGEINQTTLRVYIDRDRRGKRPLLKGVEIRMFGMNEVLSQGEREYFDDTFRRG
jgi:hypothetical protein